MNEEFSMTVTESKRMGKIAFPPMIIHSGLHYMYNPHSKKFGCREIPRVGCIDIKYENAENVTQIIKVEPSAYYKYLPENFSVTPEIIEDVYWKLIYLREEHKNANISETVLYLWKCDIEPVYKHAHTIIDPILMIDRSHPISTKTTRSQNSLSIANKVANMYTMQCISVSMYQQKNESHSMHKLNEYENDIIRSETELADNYLIPKQFGNDIIRSQTELADNSLNLKGFGNAITRPQTDLNMFNDGFMHKRAQMYH